MTTLADLLRYDRARHRRIADGLLVATAAAMPWSTSATGILLAASLIALLPLIDWTAFRRDMTCPAYVLPVALVALGFAGMLWADVSLSERLEGIASFLKLLTIPLFIAYCLTSEAGPRVFAAYVLSCIVLLIASYASLPFSSVAYPIGHEYGVVVRNAATQSGEFVTCVFGLLYVAHDAVMRRRWLWGAAIVAVIAAMLHNIAFIATSRTALVLIVVLLALYAVTRLPARGMVIVALVAAVIGGVVWNTSDYLRQRVTNVATDLQTFNPATERNSAGERMEFARKSVAFIAQAPLIGHGTGTIHKLFIGALEPGVDIRFASTNPHNQTFAVGIQLGFAGIVLLWAMWIAHGLLFRGDGLAAWVGFVIVAQNVVGSLFNSHLFDFQQGWVYAFGVGVAGGMMLRDRARLS